MDVFFPYQTCINLYNSGSAGKVMKQHHVYFVLLPLVSSHGDINTQASSRAECYKRAGIHLKTLNRKLSNFSGCFSGPMSSVMLLCNSKMITKSCVLTAEDGEDPLRHTLTARGSPGWVKGCRSSCSPGDVTKQLPEMDTALIIHPKVITPCN